MSSSLLAVLVVGLFLGPIYEAFRRWLGLDRKVGTSKGALPAPKAQPVCRRRSD